MQTILETGLLIDGQRISVSQRPSAELYSPHDGRCIAKVAQADDADVDHAVKTAHTAFLKWSALTAYERQKTILKATAHVRNQASEIGLLMALEQGKPLAQSISEITASCDTIDYFAHEGIRIEGYSNPTENASMRSWVVYQPVGVCALIIPWNYPVSLLSWKLGPALATGCTAVVKPTSVTPMSPTAFCEALTDGGIPPGVLSVLNGSGSKLGEALLRHRLVEKVAMTGSTAVGKRLMEVFAPSLKKISLELGGHCPAIVCADADLDNAATVIAYKGFRNCGQSCSSINRVYADTRVHDALVEKVKAIAETMSIGDGITDPKVDLGPMATRGGVETCANHVSDALKRGAKLVTGGKSPDGAIYAKGNYYQPTILIDVSPDALVMREETFGPIVPFRKFDNLSEAITAANDTNYGLVSYLFAKDYATIIKTSEQLQSGSVMVNHGAVNTNYAPYAGWKESGHGQELSRRAVSEYLKTKHVKVQF